MKKITLVTFLLFYSFNYLQAQEQNTPAAKLAHHIADKIADSLKLSNQQRAKIFVVNMDLYKQKNTAKGKSTDRKVIRTDMQRIENKRDSMYKTVLTPGQYTLYQGKKRNLVTNNK